MKELSLYIDYLRSKFEDKIEDASSHSEEMFKSFHNNLIDGIEYYKNLISEIAEETESVKQKIREDLEVLEQQLCFFPLAVR